MLSSESLVIVPLSSPHTRPRKRKLSFNASDTCDKRIALDDGASSLTPVAADDKDNSVIPTSEPSPFQDGSSPPLELDLIHLLMNVDSTYSSFAAANKQEHATAANPCTDMPFLSPFAPEDDCLFFDPPSSVIPDSDTLLHNDWFPLDTDLLDYPSSSPEATTASICSSSSSALLSPRTVDEGIESPVEGSGSDMVAEASVAGGALSGERTVMIMTSKVAQKSYGTEKRFLCPPPTTILLGESWWSTQENGQGRKIPPTLRIRVAPNDAKTSGVVGDLDWYDASTGTQTSNALAVASPDATYGKCIAKHLHINDVAEKLKKVQVTVDIQLGNGHMLGTFASKDIKVISKPSKKRQSSMKNMDLYIHHGSTISLLNRIRSQTVSTKYLGTDKTVKDGPLSFVTQSGSWDPFVIWAVNHPSEPAATATPSPLYHPTHAYPLPPPPPNALPIPPGTIQPIRYNQHVVLQCVTTGRVSPVMIIRRIDKGSKALGVSDESNHREDALGDPVSQMQRIAFQMVDSTDSPSTYLSCINDVVGPYALNGLRKPYPMAAQMPGSRSGNTCWAEEVPDTVIWTIIGTDCAVYTFWMPDLPSTPSSSSSSSPSSPSSSLDSSSTSLTVTPFPCLYTIDVQQDTITLTGVHLTTDLLVYLGDVLLIPVSNENNTRLSCVLPPQSELLASLSLLVDQHTKKLPISLVRGGVVYHTGMFYIWN